MSDDATGMVRLRAERIFKGCTRPSLLFGVPLLAALAVGVPFGLAGLWALWLYPPLGLGIYASMVPVWWLMRLVTRSDDQRLMQWLLWCRMGQGRRNRAHWGAVSYSPIRYRRVEQSQ